MPQALTTAQAAVLAFIVTHQGAHQRHGRPNSRHLRWYSTSSALRTNSINSRSLNAAH